MIRAVVTSLWTKVDRLFRQISVILLRPVPPLFRQYLRLEQKPVYNTYRNLGGPSKNTGPIAQALNPQSVLSYTGHLTVSNGSELYGAVQMMAARVLPVSNDKLEIIVNITDRREGLGKAAKIDAVPRAELDGLNQQMRSINHRIAFYILPNANGFSRLYTPAQITSRAGRILLLLPMVFLLLLSIHFVVIGYEKKIDILAASTDADVRTLREQTQAISGMKVELDALQEMSDFVFLQQQEGQFISFFAELTSASPDDVVFDEISINDRSVLLKGRAKSPEEWVLTLETRERFQDVRLRSVFDRTTSEQRRFEVTLTYDWSFEEQFDDR